MKLLVFAHTPPPHHGQSYMVKLMLDELGGDRRKQHGEAQGPIECYHVNCQFSEDMEDIGEVRFEKAMLVLRYCAEAIWCKFRYGLNCFYYVPAPGKRAALYRDWIVMLLCRPFFRKFVYHWHAVGLGDWLAREGTRLERSITRWLLGRPSLSIALAIPSMRDALWFKTRDVEIVPNGIPDPCPAFQSEVLPRRKARVAARKKLIAGDSLTQLERDAAGGDPDVFKVLYLAHCTTEKGIFDTLDAVALANAALKGSQSPLRIRLTVAGAFFSEAEEQQFAKRIGQPDLNGTVTHAGFVSGDVKAALLRGNDCYCFPTFYPAEGQPVSLLEAMAFGLEIITTRWRAIPEILPPEYPGFVPPRTPQEIAAVLRLCFTHDGAEALRARFVEKFVEERYAARMAEVLQNLNC